MTGDTLFDHQLELHEADDSPVESLSCTTLKPECGCGNERSSCCAFATWAVTVAQRLAASAPADINLPDRGDVPVPDSTNDPVGFLLSKKALGSHYPGELVALPGHYTFSYNPTDQGVMLLNALYSSAHDPLQTQAIDHRAGFRAYEPGVSRVERFFAAGFLDKGEKGAELAYSVNTINIRELVCRTQEDLEVLYQKILQSLITKSST